MTDMRNIETLPSGAFRVRFQVGERVVANTYRSVEKAVERRDEIRRRLDDGTLVHKNDVLGTNHSVCGVAPIRVWPAATGVYFCAVPGIAQVKIGWAANIRRRLNELACGAPVLVLLGHQQGVRSDELALHDRFVAYRMRREWFRLEGEVLAYVKDIRRAL